MRGTIALTMLLLNPADKWKMDLRTLSIYQDFEVSSLDGLTIAKECFLELELQMQASVELL